MRLTVLLIIILSGVVPGCRPRQEKAPTNDSSAVVSKIPSGNEPEARVVKVNVASGLYKGGLKLAVRGDSVFGYYEDASGWNEVVNAPQFSCGYSFRGRYRGSNSVALIVHANATATGTLEILSPETIRVTLSANPCENEQPTTQTWELEKAYALLGIREIAVAKSYFYSAADAGMRRKAYVVKGDRVEVVGSKPGWYEVVYHGARSTTSGWMPRSAFEVPESTDFLLGEWRAKEGEGYDVFYKFYPDHRYKTWAGNSFEPQGMTGTFSSDAATVVLNPCGEAAEKMPVRDAATREVAFMIPHTNVWTRFEKRPGGSTHIEEARFFIKDRMIRTTVNSRTISIPSHVTTAVFLESVCPFNVTKDMIELGEGQFDVLRISTPERGELFYAIVQDGKVTSIVIDDPGLPLYPLAVGATFAELRKALPSATVTRSETEGKIIGNTDDFTFSFGYLSGQLFDQETKTIPDTVRIKQIVL